MGSSTYGKGNIVSMCIKHNLNDSSIEIPVYLEFERIDNVIEDECLECELSDILYLITELAKDVGEDKEFIKKIDDLWFKSKNHFQ